MNAGPDRPIGATIDAGPQSGSTRPSMSRTPAAPDPLLLGRFHRFDAGLGYQVRGWRYALSIENLTNEYYLLAGSTGLAFSPSNPRSYALRISRTW